MHIHLPLVLEAILFSWIALYLIIYKILLRKKLSPLLASLIANSNYGFMKGLSWSAIITYPFMLFSMFYFLDYIVNDTLRMYKNDDIRMYNFNCITDTIVEVITTCNTYTLLTVHLL